MAAQYKQAPVTRPLSLGETHPFDRPTRSADNQEKIFEEVHFLAFVSIFQLFMFTKALNPWLYTVI